MKPCRILSILLVAFASFLSACGSGGGSEAPASPPVIAPVPPPPPPPVGNGSYVKLTSEPGDFVGGGGEYFYSAGETEIFVSAEKGYLKVAIRGDENWFGDFHMPEGYSEIRPGIYENLSRYPFYDLAIGGMSWTGLGRGCNRLTGLLTIDRVLYEKQRLIEVDFQFEQHCENLDPALYGEVHWINPFPLVDPGPSDPPAVAMPPGEPSHEGSSSVRLNSDLGDYVGDSKSYFYTNAASVLTVDVDQAHLSVSVRGYDFWDGDFELPDVYSELQPGTFAGVTRYGFHDPEIGGMSWTGMGRGCNVLNGSFTIDHVAYQGSELGSLGLRFEQHCEDREPALRGEIYWDANDTTSAPGRLVPVPVGLWRPDSGDVPDSPNYIYLESFSDDYIGAGENYLYTDEVAFLTVNASGPHISVGIAGDVDWDGDFHAMNSMGRIESGYYSYAERYPFQNPTKAGMDWSGDGRGCNRLTGWFAVDNVVYDGEAITELDLRFDQRCEIYGPPFYGAIHWRADAATGPPGPQEPPPQGLWQPAPGDTPLTGNYVYLQSEAGDFVGAGKSYLYTQADSVITMDPSGAFLEIEISGDERWRGRFEGMYNLNRLQVGYYGDLMRYPFHNPAKGGMSWGGEARGCNRLSAWFVVDSIRYEGSTLTGIDLRFEQHCEGRAPALYGKVHWDIDDPTVPPGPVVPPDGLWEPPPGATPDTGNYVYFESDPDDSIGYGATYLYTPAEAAITARWNGYDVRVDVDGNEWWIGEFRQMDMLSVLEEGYYGDVHRYPFHNPAKGGFTWRGQGRGCNKLDGWFAVDAISYDGPTLTSIEVRFEQHCEGREAGLRGKIRWTQ